MREPVGTSGVKGQRGSQGPYGIVKYHVSEDKSSIVESFGDVQTIRNVSAYLHIQGQSYKMD